MKRDPLILVINLGSTTTKVGLFAGKEAVFRETVTHSSQDLSHCRGIEGELRLRAGTIKEILSNHSVELSELDIIVSRGGLSRSVNPGIYKITQAMCDDLRSGRYGHHSANLGPIIAGEMAQTLGIDAVVVDPPTADEMEPIAKISGLRAVERKSALHVLSQRAVAWRAAQQLGKTYHEVNLIVVHLGGGITIGAHKRGQIVDGTHGLSEGPFTPERAGSLPTMELVEISFSGRYTKEELKEKLVREGGLQSYLGTRDAKAVEERIAKGDEYARLIYEAMTYQIAKEIGAMATVLYGEVDAIVLTGDLAHSPRLVQEIRNRVFWIAPLLVHPGEEELEALAAGGMRVWRGEEVAREY